MYLLLKNIYVDPFKTNLDKDYLFNICTGKAVSTAVANVLLNVESIGSKLPETFISECALNAERFGKAIKRTNILNFSTELKTKKVKIGDKVHEVRLQRDLFGRVLGLSMEHNIDIAKILSYPLTPVPMCQCAP